jgi:hypothetical protein
MISSIVARRLETMVGERGGHPEDKDNALHLHVHSCGKRQSDTRQATSAWIPSEAFVQRAQKSSC